MIDIEKMKVILKEYKVLILACFIAIGIVFIPVSEKEEPITEFDFSQITEIAELTTTINYYHDVVQIEDNPDLIFKYGLFRYGYKRFWMEYSGIVRMGVDAKKIKVGKPDENNVIEIYLPKAEAFDAIVDSKSMSEPIVETGLFTTITAEEKSEAINISQQKMEEQAKNDFTLLDKAYKNAKKVIQNYVDKISDATGIQYEIKWIDE